MDWGEGEECVKLNIDFVDLTPIDVWRQGQFDSKPTTPPNATLPFEWRPWPTQGGIWINVRDISTESLQNMQSLTERIAFHNFTLTPAFTPELRIARLTSSLLPAVNVTWKLLYSQNERIFQLSAGRNPETFCGYPLAQPRMPTIKPQVYSSGSEFLPVYLVNWDRIGWSSPLERRSVQSVGFVDRISVVYHDKLRSVSVLINDLNSH